MSPGDTDLGIAGGAGVRPRALNEGRGVSPGDTVRASVLSFHIRVDPLNEGRGVSPGDTRRAFDDQRRQTSSYSPLNEGRGVSPGDTRLFAWQKTRSPSLNEGQGVSPGDTPNWIRRIRHRSHAQRRPGREPRRHLATNSRPCSAGALPSLNEGRGVSPGDTRDCGNESINPRAISGAQRRPGREPRRHTYLPHRVSRGHPSAAQRRPGREPRRHRRVGMSRPSRSMRSTLNEGRGVSPGDTTGAPCTFQGRLHTGALNEGRGVSPGDTRNSIARNGQ